jgi:hypothetical protein
VNQVLWLFAVQGAFGAFDTLYYHEYRARLPAGGSQTRPELVLHALRDFVYGALFILLPRVAFHGAWAGCLALMIAAEIGITLADFVVEVRVRHPQGVAAGERVTHGIMAIIYGAALAHLAPEIARWWSLETALVPATYAVPQWLTWLMLLMGLGVTASGVRDAYAALGLPGAGFPWQASLQQSQDGADASLPSRDS